MKPCLRWQCLLQLVVEYSDKWSLVLYLGDPIRDAKEPSDAAHVREKQQAEIQGRTLLGLKVWADENC